MNFLTEIVQQIRKLDCIDHEIGLDMRNKNKREKGKSGSEIIHVLFTRYLRAFYASEVLYPWNYAHNIHHKQLKHVLRAATMPHSTTCYYLLFITSFLPLTLY